MTLRELLHAIDQSALYSAAVFFYGFYPMMMAMVWVSMATIYFWRRERQPADLAPPDFVPFVSVIVPAFDEQATIAKTIEYLLRLDYPHYEVIVVNDGSTDGTADVVREYTGTGRVRLVDKEVNEGKAMAMNDALPVCQGEILVTLDSDVVATPGLLRALVPHFASPRVGAVTGNPRVANRGSLLRDLQTLEFTSIISVQRRAQRIWGRVLTISGAVAAIRRTALLEVGRFSPEMATEDIDLTWKLQRRLWDVRYEPSAVVWMQVPPTLAELWRQRRRWARGLAQVIKRHRSVAFHWRERRMWPVFYEALLSIAWAYTFILMTLFWLVSAAAGYQASGTSPIPNVWGMLVATACLVQLAAGGLMDRRYDEKLLHYSAVAILYPLVYWMLMSLITSIYTIDAFVRKPPKLQRWKIRRVNTGAALLLAMLMPAALHAQPAERARELLWKDRPAEAVPLFREALAVAEDCGVRNDLGLALAWSDQLHDAAETYDLVIERCPEQRNTARLRKANVMRWSERPSVAERLYREVVLEGTAGERAEANVGLGFIALQRDENRAAATRFLGQLLGEPEPPDTALEGLALAFSRLGATDAASGMADRAGPSRDMRALRAALGQMDRFEVRPRAAAFSDADGTDFQSAGVALSRGWRRRGRASIGLSTSELSDARTRVGAVTAAVDAEHRFSSALALRAAIGASRFGEIGWSPWNGEVDVVFTPDDRTRVDVAVARLLITDNVAALQNRLSGTFVSAGTDRRLTPNLTVTGAADVTRWSEGNTRLRLRVNAMRMLEGIPRVTLDWPTLLQSYDEPFSFGLFSPRTYFETGPGVNVYQRFARVWSAAGYVRVGALRESGGDVQALGNIRALVQRDLTDDWSLRAAAGWSNSNVAGSGGFRRTSITVEAGRRF